jgi:hypothetical protein
MVYPTVCPIVISYRIEALVMAQMTSSDAIAQLQNCLALATDITTHAEAIEAFSQLQARLTEENPLAAELVALAWKDVIAARRSAGFWERISDVERHMSDNMTADHINLQQNHLRLVQEQ